MEILSAIVENLNRNIREISKQDMSSTKRIQMDILYKIREETGEIINKAMTVKS